MASLTMTINPKTKRRKNISVELDADKLERLAASLGFFNPDFLDSIDRAEKDYKAGRVKKISSLKELGH
jgi:hypothetical protein